MMSDCIKCWETPCRCGWDYRKLNKDSRFQLASVILGVDEKTLKQLLGDFVPEKHPMLENKKWRNDI